MQLLRKHLLVGSILALTLPSCDSGVDPDPATPDSIVIPALVAVVAGGDTTQLNVDSRVSWTSASPEVATIDSDGVITGHVAGTAMLTATAGDLTAEALVRVLDWEEGPVAPPLSVGAEHSCVINEAGETYCWGANRYGQLGTGDTISRSVPTPLASDPGFVAVSAGSAHTCGVTVEGIVWCWGRNEEGQIGNGTFEHQFAPVRVAGEAPFRRVAAGRVTTCALADLGRTWCWGHPGGVEEEPQPEPARIIGIRFNQVTVGGRVCGIMPGGETYCLGGAIDPSAEGGWMVEPIRSGGQASYRWISAGRANVCGVTVGGIVHCWGRLSIEDESDRDVSTMAEGEFVQVETLEWHGCGVRTDGAAVCWGNNRDGQLGRGFEANDPVSRPAGVVPDQGDFKAVAVGNAHTCAISAQNRVLCWGLRADGRVGDGNFGTRLDPEPAPVSGEARFRNLSAGRGFTCGITTFDQVMCWGDATAAGSERVTSNPEPVALDIPALAALSSGVRASCGVGVDGQGYCWVPGQADVQHLEDGSDLVETDVGLESFSGPYPEVCAVDGTSSVRCWSRPDDTPAIIDLAASNIAVSLGLSHTCTVAADSVGYCWGSDRNGQLGRGGPAVDYAPPAEIAGDRKWLALSAGLHHTCGVDASGLGWCWGLGTMGQLGDGVVPDGYHGTTTPVPLALDENLVAIDAGRVSVCGLTNTGRAYCWGDLIGGREYTPAPVPGSVAFTAVSHSGSHTCGLDAYGTAHCWGSNEAGQLGRGEASLYRTNVPVPVLGKIRLSY